VYGASAPAPAGRRIASRADISSRALTRAAASRKGNPRNCRNACQMAVSLARKC
jgi:hypothetical protein